MGKTPESATDAIPSPAPKPILDARQKVIAAVLNTGLMGVLALGLLFGYLQPGSRLGGPTHLDSKELVIKIDSLGEQCSVAIEAAKSPEGARCLSSMEVVDSVASRLLSLQRKHRRRLYDAIADLQENFCKKQWRRNWSRVEDADDEEAEGGREDSF
jgi:hypothetical protein